MMKAQTIQTHKRPYSKRRVGDEMDLQLLQDAKVSPLRWYKLEPNNMKVPLRYAKALVFDGYLVYQKFDKTFHITKEGLDYLIELQAKFALEVN